MLFGMLPSLFSPSLLRPFEAAESRRPRRVVLRGPFFWEARHRRLEGYYSLLPRCSGATMSEPTSPPA